MHCAMHSRREETRSNRRHDKHNKKQKRSHDQLLSRQLQLGYALVGTPHRIHLIGPTGVVPEHLITFCQKYGINVIPLQNTGETLRISAKDPAALATIVQTIEDTGATTRRQPNELQRQLEQLKRCKVTQTFLSNHYIVNLDKMRGLGILRRETMTALTQELLAQRNVAAHVNGSRAQLTTYGARLLSGANPFRFIHPNGHTEMVTLPMQQLDPAHVHTLDDLHTAILVHFRRMVAIMALGPKKATEYRQKALTDEAAVPVYNLWTQLIPHASQHRIGCTRPVIKIKNDVVKTRPVVSQPNVIVTRASQTIHAALQRLVTAIRKIEKYADYVDIVPANADRIREKIEASLNNLKRMCGKTVRIVTRVLDYDSFFDNIKPQHSVTLIHQLIDKAGIDINTRYTDSIKETHSVRTTKNDSAPAQQKAYTRVTYSFREILMCIPLVQQLAFYTIDTAVVCDEHMTAQGLHGSPSIANLVGLAAIIETADRAAAGSHGSRMAFPAGLEGKAPDCLKHSLRVIDDMLFLLPANFVAAGAMEWIHRQLEQITGVKASFAEADERTMLGYLPYCDLQIATNHTINDALGVVTGHIEEASVHVMPYSKPQKALNARHTQSNQPRSVCIANAKQIKHRIERAILPKSNCDKILAEMFVTAAMLVLSEHRGYNTHMLDDRPSGKRRTNTSILDNTRQMTWLISEIENSDNLWLLDALGLTDTDAIDVTVQYDRHKQITPIVREALRKKLNVTVTERTSSLPTIEYIWNSVTKPSRNTEETTTPNKYAPWLEQHVPHTHSMMQMLPEARNATQTRVHNADTNVYTETNKEYMHRRGHSTRESSFAHLRVQQ